MNATHYIEQYRYLNMKTNDFIFTKPTPIGIVFPESELIKVVAIFKIKFKPDTVTIADNYGRR